MAMPQGSSSHSTRSEVQAARRRTLEDEEAGPSTSHPTIPNKDSNFAQLPVPNDLGKRGLKRRIVSDEEEEEDVDNEDDDDSEVSDQELPELSQNDLSKKKTRERDVQLVVKVEPPEKSSSEDENSMRYLIGLSFNHSVLLFIFIFLFI